MMGSRYVPPALRRQGQSIGDSVTSSTGPRKPSVDDSNLVSPEEVKEYFWPVNASNGAFGAESSSRTLHDSAATPGKLAYLFLFKDANPSWETDGLVYAKSTLEMLPPATNANGREHSKSGNDGGAADSEASRITTVSDSQLTADPSQGSVTGGDQSDEHVVMRADSVSPQVHNGDSSAPVAIFKQVNPQQTSRSFASEGWFHISNIAYLEPHSPELVHMLDQKWTHTDQHGKTVKRDRNQKAWQVSLSLRWAVIKFAKHEIAERERGPPKIERVAKLQEDPNGARKKSVNEILAWMRVQDEAVSSATAVWSSWDNFEAEV